MISTLYRLSTSTKIWTWTRPPPRLEIKPGLDKQTQIGIAVAAVLQDESCAHQLDWIKSVLTKTAAERLAWEMHSSASRITEESLPVPEAVVEPPMISKLINPILSSLTLAY